MKSLPLIILLSLTLFQCTSMEVHSRMRLFDKAVALNLGGKLKEAQSLFKSLCLKKHKASCLLSGEKVAWRAGLSIMQGSTSDKKTHFVVTYKELDNFSAYVVDKDSGQLLSPVKKSKVSRSHSDWSLSNISFAGLSPQKEYYFLIVAESGQLVDYRQFKTLEVKNKSLSFALLSCMRDRYKIADMDPIWDSVFTRKPQALFMVGDNVYIDDGIKELLFTVDPSKIWQRHMQTRDRLKAFKKFELIPVFATWDDHDFGVGDGNSQFRYKEESRKIFELFFPMEEEVNFLDRGPGLSRSVKIAGQQFLFLDNRSFRVDSKDPKKQTHFGVEQTAWIMKKVKSFKGVSWLLSGDQFFGGYQPFESYQGSHKQDFKKFLNQLKKLKRKVLFGSGDRHLTELIRVPRSFLGYESYEFTSSPVHSTVYPGALERDKNVHRINGVDGKWNYMILKTSLKRGGLGIKIEDYNQEDSLLFKEEIQFKL